MNNINGYNAYQPNLFGSASSTKKTSDNSEKTSASTSPVSIQTAKDPQKAVKLSDKAKALLKDLQKQYGNMDFIVADYNSEEEASSYLSRCTKEYTVLIDPEELERMAEDEEVKTKNLALLDEAVDNLANLKTQLEESGHGDEVINLGVSIGKDGQVSFFAELEKNSERQKAFIDSIREDKKEAQKEAEKEAEKEAAQSRIEKAKRTSVTASTAEELFDKIVNVDWSSIEEEVVIQDIAGRHFDFSV